MSRPNTDSLSETLRFLESIPGSGLLGASMSVSKLSFRVFYGQEVFELAQHFTPPLSDSN